MMSLSMLQVLVLFILQILCGFKVISCTHPGENSPINNEVSNILSTSSQGNPSSASVIMDTREEMPDLPNISRTPSESHSSSEHIHIEDRDKEMTYLTDVPSTSSQSNLPSVTVCMEDISQYSSVFLSTLTTFPSITIGDYTFGMDLKEPAWNEENVSAAREVIGETPETMEKSKTELIALLKDDTKLTVPWQNDAWLVRFLRARKYHVRHTYKLIKSYYKFKDKNRDFYDNLLPSRMKHVFEQEIMVALPSRDHLGRRILVARAKNWKPKECALNQLVRMAIIIVELWIYEPLTQIAGFQCVADLGGATWEQVWHIDLNLARKMISWIMNSAPMGFHQWGAIHVVNQPSWYKYAFNIFKPLLPEEIKKKIFIHGRNRESLHKHIPKTLLTEEYGGTIPSHRLMSPAEWDIFLRHQDQEYKEIDSYGIKKKETQPK